MTHHCYHLPVYTRNTAVRVRGVLRCAEIHYRTRTRVTRFGNTAGFTVPVRNPTQQPERGSRVDLVLCFRI